MTTSDKLPALPFYVGDWKKDPGIQCLDISERGTWLEMLFLMWESPERGFLLTPSGKPFTEKQLSNAIRLSEDLLKQILKALLEQNIYSLRISDKAIYSRKMVKDERLRKIRAESGKKGGLASQFAKANIQPKEQANTEDENANENEIETKIFFKKEIEIRRAKFSEAIADYRDKYRGEMLSAFLRWWGEPTRDKKRMKWELKETWDLGMRLESWASREKEKAGESSGVNTLSQSKKWAPPNEGPVASGAELKKAFKKTGI